ncbi:MAG: ATP-binding cassette domain-containing protein [Opitutae bacterium]|jgi:macrolide transport system ATP-binding/permease protein|nr:ATP-binding cassette domain-containing protein [Opitutae bacterium]MBT5692281.1 ATP-binding cassette domain-containing protein [Opitutae bacterium]
MSTQLYEETHFALKVSCLFKEYPLGLESVVALRDVNLEVPAGDFVAIMGPSGSGKSTLLNLLGCLDKATSGEYFLSGRNVADLSDDELAELRASEIGFVFQSYNLISQLSLRENIEVPLQYCRGSHLSNEENRHKVLAEMVGVEDRLLHRPSELSGGQQQRAGIARSLANEPAFLLADEPTGNLDTATTEEILNLFESLNQQGRTIVMVTHEEDVARRARRIIRLKDGEVEYDKVLRPLKTPFSQVVKTSGHKNFSQPKKFSVSGILHGLRLGFKSLFLHPLRSLLTALGVFIGVASVIWLLAIGEGISRKAQAEIAGLGANNIIVASDRPPSKERKGKSYYFPYGVTKADTEKWMATIPGISKIYPTRELNRRRFSYLHRFHSGELLGCTADFRELHDLHLIHGRFLNQTDYAEKNKVCVLAQTIASALFPYENPLEKQIHVDGDYFRVIGVVQKREDFKDKGNMGYKEQFSDNVYIPLSTLWQRVFDYYSRGTGGSYLLSKATVRVESIDQVLPVAEVIRQTAKSDHGGIEDFKLTVPLELMARAQNARMLFIGMMGLIATISLVVGGIGIMNIMLATVTERTREIGIRRAIGARKSDITRQFLAETIVLSVVGGFAGILGGLMCGPVYLGVIKLAETFFPKLMESMPSAMDGMVPTVVGWSIPLAFCIAVSVGVLFGLYPARKASEMDPIKALRHVA